MPSSKESLEGETLSHYPRITVQDQLCNKNRSRRRGAQREKRDALKEHTQELDVMTLS